MAPYNEYGAGCMVIHSCGIYNVYGVLRFLYGNFIGGMWFCLIGLFLQGAAKSSYQQMVARKALEGEPLQRYCLSALKI
jgi:hypothetical protein